MDNQYVIQRIMKNLAFDMKPNPIEQTKENNSSFNTLNVKIKIRNKHNKDTIKRRFISNNQSQPEMVIRNVRLVNSDETLMSFDMFMKKDYEQDKPRKPRKHFFDKLKPGLCLKHMDDDDYIYLPSSRHNQYVTESGEKIATKLDGSWRHKSKLPKNEMDTFITSGNQRRDKPFLGTKCKPGGCLDPAFDEDKYSYSPNFHVPLEQDSKTSANVKSEYSEIDMKSNNRKGKNNRTSKDIPVLIKSIHDIKAYSNISISLITYPPHDENNKKIMYTSNLTNEDRTRQSINIIFNPLKCIKRDSNSSSDDLSQQPSSKIEKDVNQAVQKMKKYLNENELQYQQQLGSVVGSNMKSGSNIKFHNVATVKKSLTSYSTDNESNIYSTELSNKDVTLSQSKITNCSPSIMESVSSLSQEIKRRKCPDSTNNIKDPKCINQVDTSGSSGKAKKEQSFLGTKCKPGGCLDPSFDEDTYAYSPMPVLPKQDPNIAESKQENSDIDVISNYIHSKKNDNKSEDIPNLVEPSDDDNDKQNTTITYKSDDANNTRVTVIMSSDENNLKNSNNNSTNSFIKPCKELMQNLTLYNHQNSLTYNLDDTKNVTTVPSDNLVSPLSTYLSSEPNLSTSINNGIQSPKTKLSHELLQQEPAPKNIENKETPTSLIIENPVNLSLNTEITSMQINSTSITSIMTTKKSFITKDRADCITCVVSLNSSPIEQRDTSSTINIDQEDNNKLTNQISPSITNIRNIHIEPDSTNNVSESSNNVTYMNTNSNEFSSHLNIYKKESPRSMQTAGNDSQATGYRHNGGNNSLKISKIIANKFEQSVDESMSSLFSPSKKFEPNLNVQQNSFNYNLDTIAKTEQTEKPLSLLYLSVSSKQNISINTIQSIYNKSANNLHQNVSTAENFAYNEISLTNSLSVFSYMSLDKNTVTNENVSLHTKDIKQPSYSLIATDTVDLVDKIDADITVVGANDYENDIHQFKIDQSNVRLLLSKTQEEIQAEIPLNSKSLPDPTAINSKNVECNQLTTSVISISTIKFIYTNSANNLFQSVPTAENIAYKELASTTSVSVSNHLSLEKNIITNENVSLYTKDDEQPPIDSLVVTDTVNFVDKIDAAITIVDGDDYEKDTHQFEMNQYNASQLFSTTEEEIQSEIRLNSQFLTNQTATNTNNVVCIQTINLSDSNETVIEQDATIISANTVVIEDNIEGPFDDKTMNAANNNKNTNGVNEFKELQQNKPEYEVQVTKDQQINKKNSFIKNQEMKLGNSDAQRHQIDKIEFITNHLKDQETKIEIKNQPQGEYVNKNTIRYHNINQDDLSSTGQTLKIVPEYPDVNYSHYMPSTLAEQTKVPIDILVHNKKELEGINQSERVLISSEHSPLAKLNDTVILDIIFHSYTNDRNQRIIKTIKDENEVERYPNDSTFILKSQLQLSPNKNNQKISIPLASDLGLTIKIENNSGGVCSETTTGQILTSSQTSTARELNKEDERTYLDQSQNSRTIAGDTVNTTLTYIYEQNLLPLQTMIRTLKHEIDDLGKQQTVLKKQLLSVKQTKMQQSQCFKGKSECNHLSKYMYRSI